jgi:hypothetical protein
MHWLGWENQIRFTVYDFRFTTFKVELGFYPKVTFSRKILEVRVDAVNHKSKIVNPISGL